MRTQVLTVASPVYLTTFPLWIIEILTRSLSLIADEHKHGLPREADMMALLSSMAWMRSTALIIPSPGTLTYTATTTCPTAVS